jgi:GNAT superfamily N-acetyltransferase
MTLILEPDSKEWPAFSALTYPGYRDLLLDSEAGERRFGVGYELFCQPVGLALASVDDNNVAWLLSVLVLEEFRNKGIATDLLARLADEASRRGCTQLRTVYPAGKPATPALERLLQKQGWAPPRPRHLVCRSRGQDVERMMRAKWMNAYPLPAGFQLFPWAEATPEELARLPESLAPDPTFKEELSPFFGRQEFEATNSLGLRYQGEIVGWMLTRRLAAGLILYDRLFVRQAFQRTGRGISLLAESIKRQYAHEGHLPDKGGVWLTQAGNLPMVRFIKRRMAPYLTSILETNESYKELSLC